MSDVVGQGRLVVTDPAVVGNSRHFGFQVSQQQIQFYNLSDPTTRFTPLEWWTAIQGSLSTPEITTIAVVGHVVLAALPAAPNPAFSDISVGVGNVAGQPVFTLTVRQLQGTPFGVSASGHVAFQDLDITFTQTVSGVVLSGGVKVIVLFDPLVQPVALSPAWNNGALVFAAAGSKVPVGQVGVLEQTQITVRSAAPFSWEALQILYTFEADPGGLIRDTSGQQPPIDLTVYTPELVSWSEGVVTTKRGAAIATAPLRPAQPLPQPRPTQRLIKACQATRELSVVLWFKPTSNRQEGPARLITLSSTSDDQKRNFLIAQEKDRYIARLRTTMTDENGRIGSGNNRQEILQSPAGSVRLEPTYLVFTRSVSGADGAKVSFYLNGELVESARVEGDFSNWQNFELTIANEFKFEGTRRAWEGEFYRVAVYSQALTPEQVRQQYYPHVVTTGELQLLPLLPAPLDRTLAATVAYKNDHSLILATAAQSDQKWLATPQFQFDQITLSWKKARAAGENSPTRWVVESTSAIAATLWGTNTFTLVPKGAAPQPEQFLPLVPQPRQTLNLRLEGLGQLKVNNFELQSDRVNGRPQWELVADVRESEIDLPGIDRPFDFKTDFKLTSLDLVLEHVQDSFRAVDEDRILLTGKWLGQSLGFYGVRLANRFLLRSATLFELPFNLTLGPIYQPGTTISVADQVTMCPTPGCRQVMSLDVLIELSSAGFMAVVNSRFPWRDTFGRERILRLPEFTLFDLPTTPNALLAEAIAQLTAHADSIFAPVIQSEKDFYGIPLDNQLSLVFAENAGPPTSQKTLLPPVLSQNAPLTAGLLQLEQSDTQATLTLDLAGKSASTVKTDYDSFLRQLSARAKGAASFALVRQRLAERLPVALAQGLQFTYGYTGQTVDLVGGMRLRVEYQNYQFVHPVDKTAETGFVSSGMAHYALSLQTDAEGDYLSFDPFLAAVPVALEGPNSGISGLIDLLRPGYRKPFYQLVYPDEFLAASGRVGAERVAILVGADDFNTLQQAADYYIKPSAARSQPPANVALAYFRGRATVVPEIAIFVQEQPEYVPVGTTLRQLAERYGHASLRGRLQRLVHEGVNNAGDYRFVNLGHHAAALDLPLVQGDRVYF
ncbi:LamG-like jellyroll fold domain-containing protein [Leptothoe sp. PORK10 BA2]|uniref:LamG-like jellyroll fold domain-containing protein n=1 Tax=Leptothoe sp. PORK10 BA2 TaxID=3110254 RepID=UPI002B1FE611|nr:LamG-like jellyroll fold domain-containing protein [Leptothoe sp. PORK10 BA2]MEA5464471.1 LamG-like jellyroll fold domain-containing protein [Leptothoe sp. PORK10 BA2]